MTIEVAIFHAQLECPLLCRCTESAAPALSRASPHLMSSRDPPSRASPRRLNDVFNVMSFLHGSDFSRLLQTTNICVQRQDTLIGAFCATKSASQYWRTKYCWLPVPLDMLPWLSCLNSVFLQSSTHCRAYSQCTGTQTHSLSKSLNSFTFNLTFFNIRTCSLELTLFPDVDELCAFNDESNLRPRSIRPTTKHRHRRPGNPLTPRQQEVLSAFNPGHLSGRTQDANYVSFQLQSHAPHVTERHCLNAKPKHSLAGDLFCCITRVQLRQTSFV